MAKKTKKAKDGTDRGRPSDYSPDILVKARADLKGCKDSYESWIKQENLEKGYIMHDRRLRVEIPTIEGLAIKLKVHRDTLYAWAKEFNEFSDILEELRQEQAKRLINKGLSGEYNSTITKILLIKHGYVDKLLTEHSGGITVTPEEKQKIKEHLKKIINGK